MTSVMFELKETPTLAISEAADSTLVLCARAPFVRITGQQQPSRVGTQEFSGPTAVALDGKEGKLYICDGSTIRCSNAATGESSLFAGKPSSGTGDAQFD